MGGGEEATAIAELVGIAALSTLPAVTLPAVPVAAASTVTLAATDGDEAEDTVAAFARAEGVRATAA